jgi:hypothetical protein
VPDGTRYLIFDWVDGSPSLPMIIGGLALLGVAYRRREPSGNYSPR